MKKKYEEMKLDIPFSSGVKYNGLYFLAALHMNALFLYGEKEDKLLFLTSFKKEKKRNYLYVKAFLYKDEAWFIPYCADNIAIVNLEKLTIDYIPVCKQEDSEKIKFVNYVYFEKEYLCLVPWEINAAIIIHLKSKKIQKYVSFQRQKTIYPYHGAIYYNERIYFFPWNEKNILELNLKTDQQSLLPWKEDKEAFGDVIYDKKAGQLFYAPARKDYIRVYDFQEKSYKNIRVGNWDDNECRTYYATDYKREIFFWGHEKNIVVKFNKDTYQYTVYQISHNSAGTYFFPVCPDGIEALVFGGNCIIRYDTENDSFKNMYFSTKVADFFEEIDKSDVNLGDIMGYEGDYLQESISLELCGIIPFILRNKKEEMNCKDNIGNDIYRSICRDC